MKRYLSWALIAVLAVLAATYYFTSRKGAAYQASDPTLLSATGRPQLVEFYHRA